MLVIKTKQYEVEEVIQVIDENEKVLYEFTMQITPDELKKIESILVHKDGVKATKELDKLNKEGNFDLIEAKEKELEEMLIKAENEFADITFKEHKDPFIAATGEYRYNETLEMMFDFFWNAFTEKKAQQINTMTSSLSKIMNK